MTIHQAFEQLMATASFANIAKNKDKEGGHYRMCRTRFKREELKHGAMVDLLIEHGYKVTVKK